VLQVEILCEGMVSCCRLKCNVKEWCFMLQVEILCEGMVSCLG